uniref:Uncharacterized protein n=1 Tax=Octactis speculum TaxID=3111310 RepID=A0A7S2H7B8_9STRA|mmetsp:Transcript_62009/g.85249  ORF Transcript_62009/g.85249 Transcript_62009/m.85249 type:complete len:144 (+) Transcript_62009:262-693(+)
MISWKRITRSPFSLFYKTKVFLVAALLILQDDKRAYKLLLPLYAFIHVPFLHLNIHEDVWGQQGAFNDLLFRSSVLTITGSLCGVLGCAIMMLKIPECWFPGKLDVWGHSHQWWHVLTILGPLLCMASGLDLLSYRLEQVPCA